MLPLSPESLSSDKETLRIITELSKTHCSNLEVVAKENYPPKTVEDFKRLLCSLFTANETLLKGWDDDQAGCFGYHLLCTQVAVLELHTKISSLESIIQAQTQSE